MAKSIRDISKKKETRGRKKTTGPGEPILLRLHPPLLTQLDEWIAAQQDQPSRPEGIRRLVEQALAGTKPRRPTSSAAAHKASELAAETIERLTPVTHAPEEKQRAKRRLIQGPKEFRDIRGDQPKPKQR
jgi:hypothetical protein